MSTLAQNERSFTQATPLDMLARRQIDKESHRADVTIQLAFTGRLTEHRMTAAVRRFLDFVAGKYGHVSATWVAELGEHWRITMALSFGEPIVGVIRPGDRACAALNRLRDSLATMWADSAPRAGAVTVSRGGLIIARASHAAIMEFDRRCPAAVRGIRGNFTERQRHGCSRRNCKFQGLAPQN